MSGGPFFPRGVCALQHYYPLGFGTFFLLFSFPCVSAMLGRIARLQLSSPLLCASNFFGGKMTRKFLLQFTDATPSMSTGQGLDATNCDP